jgi:cysteine desulfurase
MPILPGAREAMNLAMDRWANPSSPHAHGRASRAMFEEARYRIAQALGWTGEVIFTSGASESLAIALASPQADARLISSVEHDAVHRAAPGAYIVPVGNDGLVSPDALAGRLGALGAKRPLVAIQAVNSETGVKQPLDALGQVARRSNAILLVDAAQSAGKAPLPKADMIAVCAHKFGGPPGVGALLINDLSLLAPTGGQEQGYRAGTENLPGVWGMAAALEAPKGWIDRAADLRAHLDAAIESAGGEVVAKASPRLSTVASYRMPDVLANAQLIQFDMAGISVSAGSACSSGTLKSSRVLAALGWAEAPAREVVRVSFGPDTSRADVYRFLEVWRAIAGDAKSRAA